MSNSVTEPSDPESFADFRQAFFEEHRAFMAEMAELKEQGKETDRRMQETALQMKDTDRRLKKAEALFTSQWGKLMESLVDGDLVPLLRERGIAVNTTYQRRRARQNGEHVEFDIVAMNGEEAVVVEVKTTLRPEDVKEFLPKLSAFAEWFPDHRRHRVFGAVAYLDADSSVIAHAQRQGLFVIRATGSSASIINEGDFEPRVFS